MERSLKRPKDAAFLPSASTSGRDSVVDLVSLEDDALARVFRLIGDPKSLARLSLVSKRWRDALSTCGAWRMLCLELGRAPRMPRKPWRDIYLDALRRRIEDDRYAHELLMLRVTTQPGRSALPTRRVGNATHRAQRADASGLGALRLDRPVSLRRALEKQPRLDVNHRSLTYGGRTLLGIAARLGSPSCAKELINGFGADVDVLDDEGWSPLMEAAFRGNEVLALFLLENGAINEGVLGARPDALVLESEEDETKGLRKRAPEASTKKKRSSSSREPEPETRTRREGVGLARAANEWARARGNVRLAAMIERHQRGERIDWRLESGGELVKTNVTPFSI
jgi:hypothetical protein